MDELQKRVQDLERRFQELEKRTKEEATTRNNWMRDEINRLSSEVKQLKRAGARLDS